MAEVTSKGLKEVVVEAKGPSADTTVGATSYATITLNYQKSPIRKIEKVKALTSLDLGGAEVLLTQVVVDESGVKVRVYNPSNSDTTITANSATAKVLAEGI